MMKDGKPCQKGKVFGFRTSDDGIAKYLGDEHDEKGVVVWVLSEPKGFRDGPTLSKLGRRGLGSGGGKLWDLGGRKGLGGGARVR